MGGGVSEVRKSKRGSPRRLFPLSGSTRRTAHVLDSLLRPETPLIGLSDVPALSFSFPFVFPSVTNSSSLFDLGGSSSFSGY